MDENYFDQKIKESLDNHPAFSPQENEVLDLQKRLYAAMPRKRRTGLAMWLVLPFLLLPMAIGAFYFYEKYTDLHENVEQLSHQINILKKDSIIVQKKIIYQFDTIYKTVYREVVVERENEQIAVSNLNSSDFLLYSRVFSSPFALPGDRSRHSLFYLDRSYTVKDYLGQHPMILLDDVEQVSSAPENKIILKDPESIKEIGLGKINSQFDYLPELKKYFSPGEIKPAKRNINPLWYFVPQGMNIGVNYSLWGSAKTLSGNSGFSQIGVSGEIIFPKDIRLHVGINRVSFSFEEKEFAAAQQYPQLPPDNAGDLFREMKGDFTYLQIPVQLKYSLFNQDNIRPVLGFGFSAYRQIKQQFKYEYIGSNGEYDKSQNFDNGEFSVNNLYGSLGIEYHFKYGLSANLEGFYHHGFDLNPNQFFELRYWGVNVGMRKKL